MAAFGLGAVQLAAPRKRCRTGLGWFWVALMVAVSGSAFFIDQIRLWGQWSPVHLLPIVTLTALPLAVWYAHNHAVRKHRDAMVSLFIGAPGIAFVLTLLPGRVIHAGGVGVVGFFLPLSLSPLPLSSPAKAGNPLILQSHKTGI
jgi:uncharacterized membrane protein